MKESTRVLMTSNHGEWYTPRHITDAARYCFGKDIELDPCSCYLANASTRGVGAKVYYDESTDALREDCLWDGFDTMFMNPPYGRNIGKWVNKFYLTALTYGTQGILLVPARTDTAWFQLLRNGPICFVRGRLKFWSGDGRGGYSATFPSAIAGVNVDTGKFIRAFDRIGDIWVRAFYVGHGGPPPVRPLKGSDSDSKSNRLE